MHDRLDCGLLHNLQAKEDAVPSIWNLVPAALEEVRASYHWVPELAVSTVWLGLQLVFATVGWRFVVLDCIALRRNSGLADLELAKPIAIVVPRAPIPLSDNSIPPVKPDGVQAKGVNYTL